MISAKFCGFETKKDPASGLDWARIEGVGSSACAPGKEKGRAIVGVTGWGDP